ncbi:MFS transporter [Brevibacterium aurantiacum]|uniref:MFS transporter n=1 Tax=Brevibacterium aurantiacum TaxID=273384 RepID=UPI001865D614|nr:MFS transporter [Brevibacterium aurantiacum]
MRGTSAPPTLSGDALSRRIYVLTAVFSAVLYTVLLVAPVIAFPLTAKFGLDASQIGLLFSCELGAFSLATLPAYLWLSRVPLVHSVGFCTAIVILGNFASGFVTSFEVLLIVRIITSLAAGSITVVLLALGPKAENPGRAFGLFVVCQLIMGALILAVFPALYADADVSAMYWTLAGLAVVCLFFVPMLRGISLTGPDASARAAEEVGTGAAKADQPARMSIGRSTLERSKIPNFVAGLISILLFYIALSGVWTFMGQLSTAAGNSENTTSLVLMVATVAGIASALLATVLGSSPRRRLYLLIGFVVLAVSLLVLLGGPALLRFAVAAILFKFGWTFVLPYLIGSVSALGGGPQTMNTVNLMIGGGFALGPIVSGALIAGPGGFTALLITAFVVLVIAMAGAALLTRVTGPAAETSSRSTAVTADATSAEKDLS